MKNFSKFRALMVMVFMLLGTMPAFAVERPFALNGSGVATITTDELGRPISAVATASGTATHLGRWTVSGNVTYTPDSDGVIHSSVEGTLTASDGDKLLFQINGILDPAAGIDQGTFRFVGGTGRFEGASGDSNFVVTINPLTGGFDLTVVGKINY